MLIPHPGDTVTRLLDVKELPAGGFYSYEESELNIGQLFDEKIRTLVINMMETGLVTGGGSSFGFAMANPDSTASATKRIWDDPKSLVFMTGGWGPNKERYIANAVRKLRLSARTGQNTLELATRRPEVIYDAVESAEEDGTFQWGDFPYGGAVWLYDNFSRKDLLGAVSGLSQYEDDAIATVILRLMALAIF